MRQLRTHLTLAWALVAVAALIAAGSAGARAATTPSSTGTGAPGSGAGTGAPAPPRAQLTGYGCHLAIDPSTRSIQVTAVMRPLAGTWRMAIRFDLLSRVPGGTVTEIRGGDLGVYRSPANPTLGQLAGDVWRVHKLVVPLAAPAVYHLRAAFRWTGQDGRVLGTAIRVTPACRQRELRPNLVVRSITVTALPGKPDRDLYTALLDNTGSSAAGPFSVLFAPGDGSAATTKPVAVLDAHSHRTISFIGPLCSSATAPTITADSALQVQDLDRSDNALVATCPAS